MASTAVPARRLTYEEARARVLAAAPSLASRLKVEDESLDGAPGRVLAEPLVATEPFPRFDNSAVDGYAARSADLAQASENSPVRLRVLERIAAGHEPQRALSSGQAALVMTGAPIPPGADCVVMRERTKEGKGEVSITSPAAAGENVRPRGEDVREGDTVLEAGTILAPGDVAVLAAFGYARVPVRSKPRVAILSTGDELREPGESIAPGQIYDSNSYSIRALARAAGADVRAVWRVLDDVSVVENALKQLLAENDVVLSLGGVSAGDFDVVKFALERFSDLELWRVGMRPGGPQAFGVPDGAVFYGLPGNPVSSAVVFDRMVRPLLQTALGVRSVDRPVVRAKLAEPVKSVLGRRDFLRVRLEGAPGSYEARLTGTQSSGAVSSLAKADGLAVILEEHEALEAGTEVDVILWDDV